MDPHSQFAPRVLLAVDDAHLRRSSEAGLRAAGFAVSAPTDADAASILAESFAPDVVVVDTSLHDREDRPLYQHLRTRSDRYLLCIEPAGRDRARVEVLRSGADDAVSLPISPDELAARCQALLRRPRELRSDHPDPTDPAALVFGPLAVDTGRHEIRLDGRPVPATRIEFSLLEALCRRPGEVCSRADLLLAVWGPTWVGDDHVVDVHLSNLRRKLEQAAPGRKVIHTVRGVGFRLDNELLDAMAAPVAPAAPSTVSPAHA
jgi:two-component system OmpR family response regulator